MNLNADIGEGAGEDEAILACIDSANIACGVHAGSASLSITTAWRCRELLVIDTFENPSCFPTALPHGRASVSNACVLPTQRRDREGARLKACYRPLNPANAR